MSCLEESSPAEGIILSAPSAEDTFRYDQIVDGLHACTIAKIATEYLSARKPLGLEIERDQAKHFAESVRRLFEMCPDVYHTTVITRTTIHKAIEGVISAWIGRSGSRA